MNFFKVSIAFVILSFVFSCAASDDRTKVLIKTNQGDVTVVLYDETPQHRDNFVKLVNENFYDSLLFHRVIKDFMIQAGDPKSKGAKSDVMLGGGGPGYQIPPEFNKALYHKKGVLSAARQGDRNNPEKKSSGSQFYIVVGEKFSDQQLDQVEQKINSQLKSTSIRGYLKEESHKAMRDTVIKYQQQRNGKVLDSLAIVILDSLRAEGDLSKDFKFTEQQRMDYKTIGGTPFLDTQYTVFGEVIKGLEIVEKIALVPTLEGDRPTEDVVILEMKVVK